MTPGLALEKPGLARLNAQFEEAGPGSDVFLQEAGARCHSPHFYSTIHIWWIGGLAPVLYRHHVPFGRNLTTDFMQHRPFWFISMSTNNYAQNCSALAGTTLHFLHHVLTAI